MNRRTGSIVIAILTIATVPAAAQWLNAPAKGIPRTKDGKPDLSAPAPRKADGKPDLSGIWQMDENIARKYSQNILADFKPGELSIPSQKLPSLGNLMTGDRASEFPSTRCLPPGIWQLSTSSAFAPLKIVQESDLVVILYEAKTLFRQIFLDGRTLPKDPNPTWLGYSVGRWEGDLLVVDSTGFNGKSWLDNTGRPTTEALHITERFRRRDFGHLDLMLTFDDPKAYTKPWAVTETMYASPDNELMESVCNENEKDVKHLPGK